MLMLLSLLFPRALAGMGIGQASNDKDYLGNRNVPPNVIFVIDVHNDTQTLPCFATADLVGPCIDQIESALATVLPRENWARFGIAYTRSSLASMNNFTAPTTHSTGAFYGIEPNGTGTAQTLSNAIDFLSTIPSDVSFEQPNTVRNPAESIRSIYLNVLRSLTIGDGWNVSPVLHSCQDTHIILITTGRPTNGDDLSGTLTTMGSGGIRDVCCDDLGNYTSGSNTANCLSGGGAPAADTQCQLDNVAREMWLGDGSAVIAGTQKVRLHTIYLDDSTEAAIDRTIADALYANVQTVQSSTYAAPFATSYIRLDETVAGTNSYDIAPAIRDTLWHIRDRAFAEDTPGLVEDVVQGKVDTRGEWAALAYSSLVGEASTSRAEARDSGHIAIFRLQSDPTSSGYGLLITPAYIGDMAANESVREETGLYPANSDFPRSTSTDMNRNVYTYLSSAEDMLTGGDFTTWKNAARMPFDHDLELALASETSPQFPNWLTGMLGPTAGTDPDQLDADFDGDMDADVNDFSNVIAFAHDWDSAVYRWGYQGSPAPRDTFGNDRIPGFGGAMPAVVDYDTTNQITSESTYETFLDLLSAELYGAFVFVGANDGTLRAFNITDPGSWWGGSGTNYGYEVFRWIPEGVLARDPASLNNLFPSFAWHGSYTDQLIYGRRLLGGGSVTVRDVWIDSQNTSGETGFGTKECTTLALCEWRRIAVMANEENGGGVLVLDITNPFSPTFLREYYPQDGDGMGTSRPTIGRVFDDSNGSSSEHVDRTVMFFGSGRPQDIRNAPGDGTRHAIEPGIRTLALTQTKPTDRTTYTAISKVFSPMPDWSTSSPDETTYDTDSNMEFGGIESPLAVLDTDADGDADTAYFTLTKTFRESADLGAGEGSAPWNSEQPPSTSLYKACRETAGEPGTWTYLELANLGATEVYYAPTLSYFTDGSVGIFLVTSTPYELDELDYTAMADTSTAATQQRVYFGYDSNPDGCSTSAFTFTRKDTATGGPACTSNQYILLPQGERVVADPVIFGGYLLLSTYFQTPGFSIASTTPACTIAATSGRIRAYNYESCVLVNPTAAFSSGQKLIPGYPSNIAISDYGTVIAMGSNAASSQIYAINVNVGLFESVKVLNWMQVF